MKNFLKYTLASALGVLIVSVVFFIIAIATVVGMLSGSEAETVVSKNSVMMLDLNGSLSERSQDNPLNRFLGDEGTTYGLDDILASIKKAKENENIKGIYIQATSLGASYASRQEIRDALEDFKSSGKFIVAYGDYYTQGLYYLSSVADKVLLNPKGKIEWRGIASQTMFFKDLFDKLGIEMQVVKVGTYKSAVEPYIGMEMSDANREQVTAYINSVWNEVLDDVSASRKLSKDELNAAADKMLMFYQAEESVKAGLADTLIYKNDVRNYLKKLVGIDEDDRMPLLGLNQMVNVKKDVPKDKSGNVVAIYYAYGNIDMSASYYDDGGINSNKVIRDLRKLKEDEDVKAVVFRVNSGGGSAFGSEQIWKAIEELKAEKPVVVSMGDYAASGGYYISCGADCIVAEPTTLTGSIGIFGMIPNVEGLTKKIGVSVETVNTNKYSDFGTTGRPLKADEKSLLQMMINDGYDLFLTRCAEGRGMSKENLEKIAEGRVWTGVTAKELGLVDELGGIDKALAIAIEKAKVDAYTVLSYPAKESFLSTLLEEKPTNYVQNQILKSNLGDYYKSLNLLKNLQETDRVQALMPFILNIN